MADTIKLPGLGPVKKSYALVGGGGIAVLFVYLYRKHAQNAAANTAAASQGTATPSDAGIDPATGYAYGSPEDQAAIAAQEGYGNGVTTSSDIVGYDASGNPIYSTSSGGSSGYTGITSYPDNAAWAQAAEAYFTSNNLGDVSAALGAYIAGSGVTPDQENLIHEVIAYFDNPPVNGPMGYPPSIKLSAPPQGGTPVPGGSTGGTTGGSTGGSSWTFPAPSVSASHQTTGGYRLSWNAVTGPQGQKPTGYTVHTISGGRTVDNFTVNGTSTAEYGQGGKGMPKGTYTTEVWANGAPAAPPHGSVTVTLSK